MSRWTEENIRKGEGSKDFCCSAAFGLSIPSFLHITPLEEHRKKTFQEIRLKTGRNKTKTHIHKGGKKRRKKKRCSHHFVRHGGGMGIVGEGQSGPGVVFGGGERARSAWEDAALVIRLRLCVL